MACMTPEEIDKHIYNLMATYKGDVTLLADAVGALKLGQNFGYSVLMIVYSPPTYRKYQKALGLEFKDVLPETAEFTERSAGYKLFNNIKDFWKIVKREVSVDPKERTMVLS
jgi:hypothetical protein